MDVSIIVPTFNEADYLENCLKSLKQQDFKGSYELIVSDSYSDDGTTKIAEQYADKIVSTKKYTIALGRQAGAEIAEGNILVFTDADVIAPRDWLRQLVSNFKNPEVVGVHGLIIPYDGRKFEKIFCEKFFPVYSKLMVKLKHPSPPGSNMAVRRAIFKKIRGFDVNTITSEDVFLAYEIKKYGDFVFDKKAVNYVSTRRLRAWGYKKYISYYSKNTLLTHFFKKASKEYEHVK